MKVPHFMTCCQDRRLRKTVKATHCGLENRSSDPGQGVRNEIIAVMERFAASGCSFLPTF